MLPPPARSLPLPSSAGLPPPPPSPYCPPPAPPPPSPGEVRRRPRRCGRSSAAPIPGNPGDGAFQISGAAFEVGSVLSAYRRARRSDRGERAGAEDWGPLPRRRTEPRLRRARLAGRPSERSGRRTGGGTPGRGKQGEAGSWRGSGSLGRLRAPGTRRGQAARGLELRPAGGQGVTSVPCTPSLRPHNPFSLTCGCTPSCPHLSSLPHRLAGSARRLGSWRTTAPSFPFLLCYPSKISSSGAVAALDALGSLCPPRAPLSLAFPQFLLCGS
ncbi:unnamed protein product [Rangifer tarandus platyrhynchus]|uniref:Uncharacterized protein n=1 Tax=Rangifer tarandus platyrhynchus TaxID=3082113 RepID=A0ABN9A3Z1_RANTA|nr:unnamed protein product [Rangifer tarandus platyrhynchus]